MSVSAGPSFSISSSALLRPFHTWRGSGKMLLSVPWPEQAVSPPGLRPERLPGFDELDGDFGNEALDPVGHFEHAGLLGDRMTEHDPALGHVEGRRIEHVFRTVEVSVGFLLLAADHDINLRAVDRRGGVADS